MDKQISLSYLSSELAQVRTKKKEYLARIEQIIPWGEWETMIQLYYYKGEHGKRVRYGNHVQPKNPRSSQVKQGTSSCLITFLTLHLDLYLFC